MEFEYAKIRTRAGNMYRPAVNVTLSYKGKSFPIQEALVDTGADFVILPLSIGKALGAEPDLEAVSEISCACGNAFNSYESRYPIEIAIDHNKYVSKKWLTHVQLVDADVTVLLGHRGFLDRFNATFFGGKHLMSLKSK